MSFGTSSKLAALGPSARYRRPNPGRLTNACHQSVACSDVKRTVKGTEKLEACVLSTPSAVPKLGLVARVGIGGSG